jgi:hypothetical protein
MLFLRSIFDKNGKNVPKKRTNIKKTLRAINILIFFQFFQQKLLLIQNN